MKNCIYCNNQTESKLTIAINQKECSCCCEECKEKSLEHLKYEKSNLRKFILGIGILPIALGIGSMIAFPMGYELLGYTMFSLVFLFVGIFIFKFPFLTPESTKKMGIKKAIKTGKNVGIIFMTGAPLVWLTFFFTINFLS